MERFSVLFLLHNFYRVLSSSNFMGTFFIHSRQIITMKKLFFMFCVLVICTTIISCRFPGKNTSISYSEHGHYYEMKARFSKSKTVQVERYMDNQLPSGDMSFRNTSIDGNVTLDDRSTFYIKKSPGFLFIKLDKDKNSDEAYFKIRSMCEGIKEVVKR